MEFVVREEYTWNWIFEGIQEIREIRQGYGNLVILCVPENPRFNDVTVKAT